MLLTREFQGKMNPFSVKPIFSLCVDKKTQLKLAFVFISGITLSQL